MTQKLNSLLKLAKVAYTITIVLRILIYIALAAMFVCLIFLMINSGQNSVLGGIFSGSTGEIITNLGVGSLDIEVGFKEFVCVLSNAIVYMIIISIILLFLGKIFKFIGNGSSPFETSNIKILKIVAVCIALLSIIPTLTESFMGVILGASNIVNFQFEIGYIVMAFFFFCLVYIFEYGAELQKQSDETL